jgi:hypothetical protein
MLPVHLLLLPRPHRREALRFRGAMEEAQESLGVATADNARLSAELQATSTELAVVEAFTNQRCVVLKPWETCRANGSCSWSHPCGKQVTATSRLGSLIAATMGNLPFGKTRTSKKHLLLLLLLLPPQIAAAARLAKLRWRNAFAVLGTWSQQSLIQSGCCCQQQGASKGAAEGVRCVWLRGPWALRPPPAEGTMGFTARYKGARLCSVWLYVGCNNLPNLFFLFGELHVGTVAKTKLALPTGGDAGHTERSMPHGSASMLPPRTVPLLSRDCRRVLASDTAAAPGRHAGASGIWCSMIFCLELHTRLHM